MSSSHYEHGKQWIDNLQPLMEVAEHPLSPLFIVQVIILLLVGLSAPNYLSLPAPADRFATDDGKFKIRIAHLILIHNRAMLKGAGRILKRIWLPNHTYVVHMDTKAGISINETKTAVYNIAFEGEAPSEDNIVFLATQNVIWGGITMIQAELDMLSAAFQTGRWWDQAILWSGRCYPLKTTDYIDKKVLEWKGKNLLSLSGSGGLVVPSKDERTQFFCASLVDKGLPECIDELYKRRGQGPVPEYRHGTQWFFISRDFALYSLSSDLSRNLLTFMANTYIPDEMFFQTLLYNSPFRNDVLGAEYSWRKEKWKGCNRGDKLPCLLKHDDLRSAVNGTQIIGRKFNPDDATYYDFVDELLGGHE